MVHPVETEPAPLRGVGSGNMADERARDPRPAPALAAMITEVEALVDDGRTYFEAELAYQKTRASFVSDRIKKAIAYASGAAILGLLAAIGLTIGLIIALTPLITAWGATAVVVGLLMVAAGLLISRAARNWRGAMRATRSGGGQGSAADKRDEDGS